MSVEQFIPTLWSVSLTENFRAISALNAIAKPVQMNHAGKYVINRVGAVQVKPYEGQVVVDALNTTAKELVITEKEYFALGIDDVQAVQLAADLMQPHVREAAAVMAENVDKHVFGLIRADEEVASKVVALTEANAFDEIVKGGMALSKAKVPSQGRIVVMGYDTLEKLTLDPRFTASTHMNVLENGIVEGARIGGMPILVSPLMEDGDVFIIHESAIAHAQQIDEIEAYRAHDSFSDVVRGLQTYGALIVREEALFVIKKA